MFLNFNKIGGFGLHNFVYSAGKLSINVLDWSLISAGGGGVLPWYGTKPRTYISSLDMIRILIDESK